MSQRLEMFTTGHSTHPLTTFVDLLMLNEIKCLVDIRRFPGSRKCPHFNQESLAASSIQASIGYEWIGALGGRRRKHTGQVSVNDGLRSESFRNYADDMLTADFQEAVNELLRMAEGKCTAYICSEAVYWRCHRRLVSDFLTAQGIDVQHLMPTGEIRPHDLTQDAVLQAGKVTYPTSEDAAPHGSTPS